MIILPTGQNCTVGVFWIIQLATICDCRIGIGVGWNLMHAKLGKLMLQKLFFAPEDFSDIG